MLFAAGDAHDDVKSLELSAALVIQMLVIYADPNLQSAITEYQGFASGRQVTMMDVVSSSGAPEFSSEELWEKTMQDVRCGCYDAIVLSPPVWSFERVHGLRGPGGRDRYGFPGLQVSDKHWVRAETLAWLRACECLRHADHAATPWIMIVQPCSGLSPSPLQLDEMVLPMKGTSTTFVEIVKDCKVEAAELLMRDPPLSLSGRRLTCSDLLSLSLRMREDGVKGACSSSQACRDQPRQQLQQQRKRAKPTSQLERTLKFKKRLLPVDEVQFPSFLGGLRRAFTSIKLLPTLVPPGLRVRIAVLRVLQNNPSIIDTCIGALGSHEPNAGPSDVVVHDAKRAIAHALGVTLHNENARLSDVDSELLASWRLAVHDWDDQPECWLLDGAPMGLTCHPRCTGIFPPKDDGSDRSSPWDLTTCWDDLEPLDDDKQSLAIAEFNTFVEKGFVLVFDRFDDVTSYLGCEPVLSMVRVISKERGGKLKHRVVFDAKASGVSAASSNVESVQLPRLLDVIFDTLEVLNEHDASSASYFILDFEDAFWQIPMMHCEQRFFTTYLGGKYYVLKRAAQGSRAGPLLWARLIALVMRLTQGALHTDARLSCYVDDPIVVLHGDPQQRSRIVAFIILCWRALGFRLSFRKGHYSQTVTWTSGQLAISDSGVLVKLKDEMVNDIVEITDKILETNATSLKLFRKYLGKLSHAASLIFQLRPFVAPLWAALAEAERANRRFVWKKQCYFAISWISAFFRASGPVLQRYYTCDEHFGRGVDVMICTDASPTGLGAFIAVAGDIKEFFSEPLGPLDTQRFAHDLGDSVGQQTWEALCVLVALRCWSQWWMDKRVRLTVRGDNVAALQLILQLKAAGSGTSLIARELALDVALSTYTPAVAEHIPGLANVTADKLSRGISDSDALPPCLRLAKQIFPPSRTDSFYKTLVPGLALQKFGALGLALLLVCGEWSVLVTFTRAVYLQHA